MIKKFYVFIFFLFLVGCSKDEYSDFKDDNLKALILENLKLDKKNLNELYALTLSKTDNIFDYQNLSKLTNLKSLVLNGFTVDECILITLNLPHVLESLIINCDDNMLITNNIFLLSESLTVFTSKEITLSLSPFDTSYISSIKIFLKGNKINNINDLSMLTDVKILSLTTQNGFDSPFNFKSFVSNSLNLTYFILVNGILIDYDIISELKFLSSLYLTNTGVVDSSLFERILNVDNILVIDDNDKVLFENVFKK